MQNKTKQLDHPPNARQKAVKKVPQLLLSHRKALLGQLRQDNAGLNSGYTLQEVEDSLSTFALSQIA